MKRGLFLIGGTAVLAGCSGRERGPQPIATPGPRINPAPLGAPTIEAGKIEPQIKPQEATPPLAVKPTFPATPIAIEKPKPQDSRIITKDRPGFHTEGFAINYDSRIDIRIGSNSNITNILRDQRPPIKIPDGIAIFTFFSPLPFAEFGKPNVIPLDLLEAVGRAHFPKAFEENKTIYPQVSTEDIVNYSVYNLSLKGPFSMEQLRLDVQFNINTNWIQAVHFLVHGITGQPMPLAVPLEFMNAIRNNPPFEVVRIPGPYNSLNPIPKQTPPSKPKLYTS